MFRSHNFLDHNITFPPNSVRAIFRQAINGKRFEIVQLVETFLAQLIAPQRWCDPIPALLEEVPEQRRCRRCVRSAVRLHRSIAEFMPDRSGAIGTESSLTRTHSETRIAAQIVEIGRSIAPDRRFEFARVTSSHSQIRSP